MKIQVTQKLSERILNDAHVVALNHIGQVAQRCGGNHDGFRWLRTEKTTPGFDDFWFVYKNQVFSVIVRIFYDGELITTKDTDQAFWNLTRQNNIIPCVFPIDLVHCADGIGYELKVRSSDDWNLENFNTGNIVIPDKLDVSARVEMSEYELNNLAVRVALHFLTDNNGFKINSFCDIPGVLPNVWFSDNDGHVAWLCVGYGDIQDNITIPDIQNLLKTHAGDYDGFFFPVGMTSSDEKLYRGSKIEIKQSGLTKIYSGDKLRKTTKIN